MFVANSKKSKKWEEMNLASVDREKNLNIAMELCNS